MTPNDRANELISVSQSLINVMTEETKILKSGKVAEIEPMQDQKSALTRIYESHLRGVAEDPNALNAADPEVRDQLAVVTTEFQTTASENAAAVHAALEMNTRLVQVIADAVVRNTPVATGYTKTGAAPGTEYGSTRKPAPASLNQSL